MARWLSALALASGIAPSDRQDLAGPDRADLPPRIESWYSITLGPRKVGAAHERLERVHGLPWRYAYTFRSEVEFETRDPNTPRLPASRSEDVRVEAFLDDALAPLYLEQTVWADEARSRWTLASGTLRAEPAGADPRTGAAESQAYGSPLLAFYALRQSGRLAREGRLHLRLLDPRGPETSFDASALLARQAAGRSKPATRLTFLKPPPAAGAEVEWKEAWIDKYGRLLEATLRNGARVSLAEDAEAAALSNRVWRSGRRDPMDKAEALRRSLRPEEAPVEPAVPPVTSDTFRSVLADADRMLQEMAEARQAGRLEELGETYFRFLAYWKALREKAVPGRLPELDDRRNQAERLYDGAARVVAQAARLYASAADCLERAQVAALEEDIARLRRLKDRIELEHRPELLEVLGWIARGEPLPRRGRDRETLLRKELRLEATVVYDEVVPLKIAVLGTSEDVRFVKRHELAVLNGKVYRPGDWIDGEGIRLEQITRQSVLVSLREELRWVPWGAWRARE
jgi:hypothetical protein